MDQTVTQQQCGYQAPGSEGCPGEALENGLCHWHDPTIIKDQAGDKEALEAWAKSGKSMRGFSLRHARLDDVFLVNKSADTGFDLRDADLNHAHFKGAHMYHIDLSGASMVKADFHEANLNNANMANCDLLGVNLHDAKVEHTQWGETILQERLAIESARKGNDSNRDNLEQAEEIYRNLRKHFESRGQFDLAGVYYYREMLMRRHQMPRWTTKWRLSWLMDYICGYGENPLRVVTFSLSFIFLCSLLYFMSGINSEEGRIIYQVESGVVENFITFADCLYFSVVTFTTLGYGDLSPSGLVRLIAAVEAFIGSFPLALFVVVFVKKMTR